MKRLMLLLAVVGLMLGLTGCGTNTARSATPGTASLPTTAPPATTVNCDHTPGGDVRQPANSAQDRYFPAHADGVSYQLVGQAALVRAASGEVFLNPDLGSSTVRVVQGPLTSDPVDIVVNKVNVKVRNGVAITTPASVQPVPGIPIDAPDHTPAAVARYLPRMTTQTDPVRSKPIAQMHVGETGYTGRWSVLVTPATPRTPAGCFYLSPLLRVWQHRNGDDHEIVILRTINGFRVVSRDASWEQAYPVEKINMTH